MLARVAAINAAQQRRYSRCQRVPQAIPTPQTGSHRHSRCCQNRQPHCSAFSSAAVRGDTATARACSSRSGEDGSTGGRHAARRQGQQQRLCFARACARLVPVERGAGRRPAGRSGQGRVGRDLSDGKRSCDSAAVSALCCNVHRRHLAPSKYEFVARCAFSCRPLGHIQVACPPVPFRFSVLVTFRAYLDYFGFRSARDVALGSHSEPLAKHVRRSAFRCSLHFFVPTVPRLFWFSVGSLGSHSDGNHWHSMSAGSAFWCSLHFFVPTSNFFVFGHSEPLA